MAKTDLPIIVAGAGPAGLLAALALARQGWAVSLVGPPVNAGDERTTALMAPALAFLAELDVMDAIRPIGAPLAAMRIVDATARLIRSPVVTFRASEIGEPYFGLNIPNRGLNAALDSAVRAEAGVERFETVVAAWDIGASTATATLADGRKLESQLVVAADGRSSPAREAAGIGVRQGRLPQSALILSFAHTRPHGSISTEFHTETGPFTQVPLHGNRSSLVWVLQPDQAAELEKLDDQALARRIEDRMQSMLGHVFLDAPRQVYPLTTSTPHSFAANRVVLVGEAAHIFPPIGAQGLNLGIRDIADLSGLLAGSIPDPGAPAIVSAYDRKRQPDILARTAAVELLNRSLLSDLLPAQMVRSAGLGLLGGISPLRAFFMREGLRPGSGFKAALQDLREQIRR